MSNEWEQHDKYTLRLLDREGNVLLERLFDNYKEFSEYEESIDDEPPTNAHKAQVFFDDVLDCTTYFATRPREAEQLTFNFK